MKTTLDVVTFGEAMALFIADAPGELDEIEHFTRSLAGAETNVAIGLARLGLRTGWVSKVGDDPFGAYILRHLRREGVDLREVKVDPRYPTGFQFKSKVASGDPKVQYYRKGSAASTIGVEDFAESYFLSARHLHMTGIPPALSASAKQFAELAMNTMKTAGRTVSFDPNLRPQLWGSEREMIDTINRLASRADWFLPGLAEGRLLTGYADPRDIAAYYLERGASLVVVKLGPEGAYYRTATEENRVPGFPVSKVVDTVGAGDGFAVGVVSGLLQSLPVEAAVVRGNAIGAMVVTSPGDSDGLPTRDQLDSFMKMNGGMPA
jgi:2-dehydro-3-deoxygluconokinase